MTPARVLLGCATGMEGADMAVLEILAAANLLAGAIQDGPAESAYTRIENCLLVEELNDPPIAISACPGYRGTTVVLVGAEHGSAVAFGPRGHDAQFNEGPPRRAPLRMPGEVVEWRIAGGEAHAAILRWFNVNYENETAGNWLVVAALRPEGAVSACQAAYVDALAVPDANALARAIADRLAPRFACGEDQPVIFGADSPDLDAVLAGWEAEAPR